MNTPRAPISPLQSKRRSAAPARRRSAPDLPASTPESEALRHTAASADENAVNDLSLSKLWRDLTCGHTRIVDGFLSETRCVLILSSNLHGEGAAIEGRRLEILLAVLSGHRQKNIALDFALAPSTVALNARLALESLGVAAKPSRAHPLLMLAARAALESTEIVARCSSISTPAGVLQVVSRPRPDLALASLLPGGELQVIRSLIEGLSYQEIAELRGTATRTVANQISAVFRRLQVSGRNELVQQLFAGDTLASPDGNSARSSTLVPPELAPEQGGPEARRSA